MPQWIVSGRTILIPKTKVACNDPEKYRPITCLNVMYTSALGEIILQHTEMYDLLPREQKAMRWGRAGCMEALLIDSMVMEHSELCDCPLSVAWIDYRKAYDSVAHRWLKRMLRDMKVPKSVRRSITHLSDKWETTLFVGDKTSTRTIKYARGVFQGDSLSPLLFCICSAPISYLLRREAGYCSSPTSATTHTFFMDDLKIYANGERELTDSLKRVEEISQVVGMEIGLAKCARVDS